jgi:K+-sensing histidine kinase KdpD
MARALPAEFDVMQHYQQFCAELNQARSVQEAVASCVALLTTTLSPNTCAFIWKARRGPYQLYPSTPLAIAPPSPNELALLASGELVLRRDSSEVHASLAPLRASGELMGWIVLEQPNWSAENRELFALVAGHAGPILALLNTISRQDERVLQLRTLNEIGRKLSGVLDFETLLEATYQATHQLVDTANFFIALYDAPSDTFELAFFVEEGVRQMSSQRWSARAGLAGVVIRERRPLCTDDYPAECERHGVEPTPFNNLPLDRAWLGVPLIAHDQIIGVISISSHREGYSYREEHIELLTTIAAQAAIALENARLLQRSARQARQLATLNQIGRTITSSLDPQRVPSLIMEQVCELLGVEEGSLLLSDDATGELVFAYTTGPFGNGLIGERLPRGVGLAGYVATQGISVIVNDVQNDTRFYSATDQSTGFTTRAILAAPLRGVGGVQGVIEIMNRRDGGLFSEEDQRLLESVADQAVIALENAQRFAQIDQALARRAQELARTNDLLQHNLRSLTALNALGMAINTTLRGADEIFTMTARGVVEMTDALGANVLLPEYTGFRAAVQIGPAQLFTRRHDTLIDRVIASARPEIVGAYTESMPALEGEGTLLIVPLRATQKTLGALCVYYAGNLPSAPDQETVVLFATQAAVAVESLQLFTAVRDAHDHMASVLASTREGIMLIEPEAHVAIANDALYHLCDLSPQSAHSMNIEQFLTAWEQVASYPAEEWAVLRQGLAAVTSGRDASAFGELNQISAHPRSIAWSALKARRSNGAPAGPGGALLVLRDITEAKESERLRQDLTNMIVHDLRSPLSSVMASIDMLIRGISGDLNNPQRSVLNIAYSSSLQMLEMINTLLDISRLEDGHMPLKLGAHWVHQLTQRAIDRLVPLAHERTTVIQSDISADLTPVHADDELVVRVLQNLLGNALNFSGRGSTVLVRAQPGARPRNGSAITRASDAANRFVTISVSDRGVGIAPKDQEKIFAKFGQVGERRGGTGLGLTFCKLVVETHGGTIWVESKLGEGSTFFFTLPTAQPPFGSHAPA